MKFQLLLDPRAIDDIQNVIDYYNEQSQGLVENLKNI